MANGTCTLPDCDKPLRSSRAQWCKMHYHRWYRHGSTEKVATRIHVGQSRGRYLMVTEPSHPLAGKNGKVYVHRRNLYNHIGPGAHACHWCERIIRWGLPKGHADNLTVDHLNYMREDNAPENLVPCCQRCNTARAQQARSDTLRSAGWWSNNDTIAQLTNGGRAARVEAA